MSLDTPSRKPTLRLTSLFIHFFVISFIYSSCSNYTETISKYNFELIRIDTLVIDIPDTIPDISTARTWAYSETYLSFLVDFDEFVLFYFDFDKNKWHKTCLSCFDDYRIEFYGPYGFLDDSVIVYGHSYKNELLLININKKSVVEKYLLSPDFGLPHFSNLNFFSDSSSILLPSMYLRKIDGSYSKNAELAMKINRKTKNISYLGNFPSTINTTENSSLNLIIPDIVFHEDNCVMSFKSDMYLHVYDYNNSGFKSVLCTDHNIKEQNINNTTDNNVKDALMKEFNGLYKVLLFDEKNKVYYRVSVSYSGFNSRLPNASEEINEIISTRTIMVSVLDKDLNILTQSKLQGVTEMNCFIKNGTLYLRSDKEKVKENEMIFLGYKLI